MPRDRARVWRGYPLHAFLVIFAALALRAPVLRTGFTVDDYAQLSMLRGTYPVPRSPLALFTFSDGSPREVAALRDAGFLPWWSSPEFRVSLFRPLSSALLWCDLRLFGENAFAYHLHSAAWWVATMALLAAVLRRVLPQWPALLALALCAAHPGHIMFLGWIANRNAVVAGTFALLGMLLQLDGRGTEPRHVRAMIVLSWALALSASEYALAFLPYAVFYDLQQGLRGARLRRLAPWIVLLGCYAVVRVTFGFGARGSGMYIDPFSDPTAFLRAASARLPVLVGDLVLAVRSTWYSAGFPWAQRLAEKGWLSAEWALDLRPLRSVQVALGVAALPVLAALLLPSIQRKPGAANATRFLALGLPFSLLPALSAFPESRLLLPGLLAWSAVLMDTAWSAWLANREGRGGVRQRLVLASTACLWLLGVVAPPLYTRSETEGMAPLANAIRASIVSPSLDGPLAHARRTLLLTAMDPTTTIYVPMVRRFHGRPAPANCQLLLSTASALKVSRVADNGVAVERLQSEYTAADAYASAFNETPLAAGQRFASDGMRVTVERVLDGRPMRALYELDTSFGDPSVVLLIQTIFGLSIATLPPVGQSIVLPGALPPFALLAMPKQ